MQATAGTISLRRALLGPFTSLSLGAGAIHFAVTEAHFQEWWAFGLFMAAIGWFQVLWPIAYVLRPSVRLALLGGVVNLGTAAVWAWSRVAGLPFGPGAGKPQAIGVPDILATLFELVLATGLLVTCVGVARHQLAEHHVPASTTVAWSAGLALLVALATSAAITVGMTSMQ